MIILYKNNKKILIDNFQNYNKTIKIKQKLKINKFILKNQYYNKIRSRLKNGHKMLTRFNKNSILR